MQNPISISIFLCICIHGDLELGINKRSLISWFHRLLQNKKWRISKDEISLAYPSIYTRSYPKSQFYNKNVCCKYNMKSTLKCKSPSCNPRSKVPWKLNSGIKKDLKHSETKEETEDIQIGGYNLHSV